MILMTFASNPGCHCRTVRTEILLSSIFSSLIHFSSFVSLSFFEGGIISANSRSFQPRKDKRDEKKSREKKKTQVSGTHFIRLRSEAEHTLCSPPASCGSSSMHGVCTCEAKADNITASHGSLRQTGNGITSDY